LRAVLDTNVIVSAMLTSGKAREVLDTARRQTFELVTSSELLAELQEVLERFVPRPVIGEVLAGLEELAVMVQPGEIPRVCRDPDDDHVVAAAVEAGARYLVTGDKDLLELDIEGLEIVSPAAFLRALASE